MLNTDIKKYILTSFSSFGPLKWKVSFQKVNTVRYHFRKLDKTGEMRTQAA